jgi:hypothetical protein
MVRDGTDADSDERIARDAIRVDAQPRRPTRAVPWLAHASGPS